MRGALTVTVCLPPFYPEPLAQACRETLGPEHVRENFFQYSLLDQHPLGRLSAKRRGAFNSEIRRALNAGVEFDWSPDRPALETWLDIYEARYAEIGAKPYPRDFYTSSWDDPSGRGRLRLVVARREGRIIGGTLFLSGQGVVDYFSTAFESACLQLYPGTALLDEAFRRFMAEGYTHFNWQSSPGRGGVFQYKARWGAGGRAPLPDPSHRRRSSAARAAGGPGCRRVCRLLRAAVLALAAVRPGAHAMISYSGLKVRLRPLHRRPGAVDHLAERSAGPRNGPGLPISGHPGHGAGLVRRSPE